MQNRKGRARVAVPSGYYKVFLREDADEWLSLAVLLEHDDAAHGTRWRDVRPDVEAAIIPLEDIEMATNQELFPKLSRGELAQNDVGRCDVPRI